MHRQADGKNSNGQSPSFENMTKALRSSFTASTAYSQYTPENTRYKKTWSIVRLEHPIIKENGDTIKYLMPKGQNSFPFFPPELVQKYENKTPINILSITEGFFKARKAAMHGVDIIGIPSITHLKN